VKVNGTVTVTTPGFAQTYSGAYEVTFPAN